MPRRYTQDQLAEVFRRSQASSWQEVLDYLAAHGHRVPGLSYDQVAEMEEDLEKLKDRGEAFTPEAATVYSIIESIQPTRVTIGPGSPTPEAEAR